MKNLFLIVLALSIGHFSLSQNKEYMFWTKIGIKGPVMGNTSWFGELNSRFGRTGVETFFPQAGLEYKFYKWLKPSIEYRFIVDKNKFTNFKSSSRINFNVNVKKGVSNFTLGFRLRYQYAFNRIAGSGYDPDFDRAFRFKPSVEYKLKGVLTPFLSGELFLDPEYGQYGPGFTKFRLGVGTKVNLKGPNTISVKYQLDKKFHNYLNGIRHVLAVSYSYRFKK
tara:strand:- start:26873 stop:27541 length:669 start_codon:yes stop_codon:yes gene_type:complete